MGCCGKKRAMWAAENAAARDESLEAGPYPGNADAEDMARDREAGPSRGSGAGLPAGGEGDPVWFEYVGDSRMNVTGSVTRRMYRFPAPGARVPVARQDAPGVRAEGDLRVVR